LNDDGEGEVDWGSATGEIPRRFSPCVWFCGGGAVARHGWG
jgi:hypothetical protein